MANHAALGTEKRLGIADTCHGIADVPEPTIQGGTNSSLLPHQDSLKAAEDSFKRFFHQIRFHQDRPYL